MRCRYAAYIFINCQSLPGLWDEPDGGEARVAGMRMVFPRYIALTDELGLFDHAETLYAAAQARSAA